jgi:succinate dehydrogenase / fumarate reductase, cytochrome b subunit
MPHPRPTSPHLQVYRLPITALISISHRITGVLLSVGLIGVVWVLWNIANGQVAYQSMQTVLQWGFTRLVYWGFVLALCFHLCHGVRHLVWDMGKSFDTVTLNRYATIELATALALTLIIFWIS